jgi:hypothetical protein
MFSRNKSQAITKKPDKLKQYLQSFENIDQNNPIKSITNSPTKDSGSPYKLKKAHGAYEKNLKVIENIPILIFEKTEIALRLPENLKMT